VGYFAGAATRCDLVSRVARSRPRPRARVRIGIRLGFQGLSAMSRHQFRSDQNACTGRPMPGCDANWRSLKRGFPRGSRASRRIIRIWSIICRPEFPNDLGGPRASEVGRLASERATIITKIAALIGMEIRVKNIKKAALNAVATGLPLPSRHQCTAHANWSRLWRGLGSRYALRGADKQKAPAVRHLSGAEFCCEE